MMAKKLRLPFFLRDLIERTSQQFWFLPTVILVSLLGLLAGTLHIPNTEPRSFGAELFLEGYSREGSRLILSSIATALMTVAGVLFSVTIVILQQVSSQYSPRVIEVFISSRTSQSMLGLYLGTFVYCLLLLRHIPGPEGSLESDIPQYSISAAIGLALICIAFLIHYVHHITHSIKSTTIIARLKDESILYMKSYDDFLKDYDSGSKPGSATGGEKGLQLRAKESGYLQKINFTKIDRLLKDKSASVSIPVLPGDYISEGELLALIDSKMPLATKTNNRFLKAFRVATSRTHAQDVRYGIRQLVDIALRALSPGVNDPSTAIEALNAIGSVLRSFTKRRTFPQSLILNGGTIFNVRQVEFAELISLAFHQILVAGKDHVLVMKQVAEVIDRIKAECENEHQQLQCERELNLVSNAIREAAGHSYYSA